MARTLLVKATEHPVPAMTAGQPVIAGRFVGRMADGGINPEAVEVPDLPLYREAIAEGHLIAAKPGGAVTAGRPASKPAKSDTAPKAQE